MKSRSLIVALAVLAIAVWVYGGAKYGVGVVTLGDSTIPTTIAASQTSNTVAVIDMREAESCAVQWKFVHGGAGTQNMTVTFSPSVDGVNFANSAAAGQFTWVIAGNGTTGQVGVTNITTQAGVGYIKVSSIANGVAQTCTTSHFKYSIKLLDTDED